MVEGGSGFDFHCCKLFILFQEQVDSRCLVRIAVSVTGLSEKNLAVHRSQAPPWDEARRLFSKVLGITPLDKPSLVYIDRSQKMIHLPPRPDWDGVWIMKTKQGAMPAGSLLPASEPEL